MPLSLNLGGIFAHLQVEERLVAGKVQKMSNDRVRLDEIEEGNPTIFHRAQFAAVAEVKECQHEDPNMQTIKDEVLINK